MPTYKNLSASYCWRSFLLLDDNGTRLPKEVPSSTVENQQEAILQAWGVVQPGDRLVIVADMVEAPLEGLL